VLIVVLCKVNSNSICRFLSQPPRNFKGARCTGSYECKLGLPVAVLRATQQLCCVMLDTVRCLRSNLPQHSSCTVWFRQRSMAASNHLTFI
jgi:hypothetical protein